MTIYDPNGFPTLSCDIPLDPNAPKASISDPDTDVCAIPNAQSAEESIYTANQVCFCKTLILNRVFILIVKMIGVLQIAAVAQSNRVNFLSQWQKAYTDAMDQVHSFAANNDDAYDDPDNDSDLISDLNQTNSIYTTALQNRRSVVSDDAKALQTTVNQTSDAVNNQSSLASSFLDELRTLLSTIFKAS